MIAEVMNFLHYIWESQRRSGREASAPVLALNSHAGVVQANAEDDEALLVPLPLLLPFWYLASRAALVAAAA